MPQIFHKKWVTAGLVVIALFLANSLWHLRIQRNLVQVQVSDLQNKVSDLEKQTEFLASSSAYFSSDAYLERQARLDLNYKLPDEQVAFVYKDSSTSAPPQAAALGANISDLVNWKKWFYYILGY